MRRSLQRVVSGGFLILLGVLACSSRDNPKEDKATVQENLTQAEISRILSFEGVLAPGGDWIPTGGTVASSTLHASAGTHSMLMSGSNSVIVTSAALSALGTVGANLSVDIWLPTILAGQSYKGNIQAFFTSQTLSLSNYSTSNIQLTTLTPGQFSRINIPLDSSLRSKLSQSNYTDLTVQFTFNLADIGQTFVDNVNFGSGTGGSGGASGTGGNKSTSGGAGGSAGTKSIGGTTSNGGTLGLGGSKTGGATSIGGRTGTGGVSSTGGTSSTGGSKTSTGGAIATGGAKATGGMTFAPTGGMPATGGNVPTGGVIIVPGTGGTPPTGGTTSTGGTIATGGANSGTSTGGASNFGGSRTAGTAGSGAVGGTFDVPYGSGPYTFSFELPPGVSRNQVVLGTTKGDLWVDDGVTAVDGSDYASVSSVDGGKVNRVGVGAQVDNVWSGGDVTLANRAIVYGSLETTGGLTQQAGSNVLGSIAQQANMTPLQTVSWVVNFPGNEQPAVNLSSNQTLVPGGYPDYDVKSGVQLNLSAGTYYFQSLMLEPGSVLYIDNSSGPVFVYMRFGYTQRGAITTAISKANVLFGVADTNPVIIDSSLNAILVVPDTSVALATVAGGHAGAVFAKSITAHQNTTITLKALQPSNFCSSSDACSSFCPCTSTSKPCAGDATCDTGYSCGTNNSAAFGLPAGSNVCWPIICATTGGIGSQCSRIPQSCQGDTDCPAGQVCGQDNGAQFQFVSTNLCWPAQCGTDPVGAGCGTINSPCGTCPSTCTPNCAGKKCGDTPDDGCGGTCANFCKNGDTGCSSDSQCPIGSVCSNQASTWFGKQAGQKACWPAQCNATEFAQNACRNGKSTCGTSCPICTPDCSNRQCGVDPICGQSCGVCADGQFCNSAAQCQAQSIDIVSLSASRPQGPSTSPTSSPVATDFGAIAGAFSVTPQGRVHYSIPLFVPPGVNGLTPKLSLEYESTVRDGEYGVGWSLGGLSTIARCPKNYAQGGPSGVSYDDNDQYCLDGTPLVRISSSPGDGAEYRTEIDSMLRVTAHYGGSCGNYTGPDHFDVHSPDGRLSRYGGKGPLSVWCATGTYGDLDGSFKGEGASTTWALTHVEDPQGNTIEYLYNTNTAVSFPGANQTLPGQPQTAMTYAIGNQPRIYEIDYGGNTDIPGNRKISIQRQSLWDDNSLAALQRFGWLSGAPYQSDERVSSISMSFEEGEVRKYFLEYDTDTPRSRLSQLFECSQEHCKQPTTFTYKDTMPLSFGSYVQPDFGGQGLAAIQSTFDANGDGLTDLLLNPFLDPENPVTCGNWIFARATGARAQPYESSDFSGSSPGFAGTCSTTISAFDLDNDGLEEVYGSLWDVYRPQNTRTTKVQFNTKTSAWTTSMQSTSLTPGYKVDFNGDGFIDDGTGTSGLALDTDGDGVPNSIAFNSGLKATNANNVSFDLGVPQPKLYRTLLEQDAFVKKLSGPDGNSCGVPCEGGYDSTEKTPEQAFLECIDKNATPEVKKCYQNVVNIADYGFGMKPIDVNGDGLKDLLLWTASATSAVPTVGPSFYLQLWINTGRNRFTGGYPVGSFMDPSQQKALDSFLNAGSFKQAFVYDVNKDGLEDLVIINAATRKIYALMMSPEPGMILGANVHLQLVNDGLGLPQWFKDTTKVMIYDVDGDGVSDVIFGEGKNVGIAYQSGADHDLLDKIIDGSGKVDRVTYAAGKAVESLAQTNISKPVHTLPPTVAVHLTTSAVPASEAFTETYSYKDGRIGYYGRGFLGFTEVHKALSTDDLGEISTEVAYYHPDTFERFDAGASAQNLDMYYEAGRPWKKVTTTHNVNFGIGNVGTTGEFVVTETRTLQSVLSDAYVPMWRPRTDTVTQTVTGDRGFYALFSTSTTTYNFDHYGQPTYVEYSKAGADGTVLEARKTTTDYKRDQAFIDRWLIGLPHYVTTVVTNDGDTVTHTENREYSSDGKVRQIDSEPDDPSQTTSTLLYYNARGNVVFTSRQAGAVAAETNYYYDSAGDFMQLKIDPQLNTMTYGYFGGYGQVSDTLDGNGLTTSRKIDPFGRERESTDANGNAVTTTYEGPGAESAFVTRYYRAVPLTIRTQGAGRPTALTFYDPFGKALGTYSTDSDGITVKTESYYDSLGRKTARTHRPFTDDGLSAALDHVYYDNLSRPVQVTAASDTGSKKQVLYGFTYGLPDDNLGFAIPASRLSATASVVRTVFPNETTKTEFLDAKSRPVAMVDRNNTVTTFAYGGVGNLTSFSDQSNLTTTYQYDRYGRPTFISDPIRGVTWNEYSPLGDTVTRTTHKGDGTTGSILSHYDLLNRPIDETTWEGMTTWTYDGDGAKGKLVNVTGPVSSITQAQHSVSYTYGSGSDAKGSRGQLRQMTNTIAGEQFDLNYDYDDLGRTQAVHYPAVAGNVRYSVAYQYSAGGRLSKVVEGDGGLGRTLWEITARDDLGRTKTAQALGAMSVGYGYTDIEGLLRQLTASEEGQQKAELDYQYDVEDNVTSIGWLEDGQFSDRSRIYQYDGSGRLTDEYHVAPSTRQRDETNKVHVDYGLSGNIENKSDIGTYTYNAPGNPYAVTGVGGNYGYQYDHLGRLTQRTGSYILSGGQTLTWTQFDAPASVTTQDGITTSYEYNGLKERVLELGFGTKKVHVGTAYQRIEDASSGQRTHSLLVTAGSMVVAEVQFTDDGATSGTADGPTVASIVSDKLGSTSIVRDSNGNYIKRSYDAFGKASAMTSPLKSGLDFAGYTQDSDTNLLWMNTRPYDSTIGRVLAPDPIIKGSMGQDGANRYSYVYNHPTSFIDPSGFDGYYFDFNMDYSFDFSPDIQGFDLSIPNMSIGTGGYYVPDVQMSVGAPDMTYAGGQYYAGETGCWGGPSYSPEQYYSYLASQYGSGTADLMTHNGVDVFHNPVPSWYPDDSTLQFAQNACLAIATGCALASGVGALMEIGVGGVGTGLSMSSLATPRGFTMGTSVLGAAGQYVSQNAGEISTMASEFGSEVIVAGPEVSSIAAEGSSVFSSTENLLFHGSDLVSVENIVENGINQAAARALGGGDVFWTTTSRDVARWFAQANPAMSADYGVVGMRLPGGIAAAEQSGIIAFDQATQAYLVNNWNAFNNIAEFFRAE